MIFIRLGALFLKAIRPFRAVSLVFDRKFELNTSFYFVGFADFYELLGIKYQNAALFFVPSLSSELIANNISY